MNGPTELRRSGGHGEQQQEGGTRRPTTRKHTIITRAAIAFFSGFFYEAMVQHVTYVTDFCRVRVVYSSWGTTPRNFQFSGTGVVARSCAATCQITRKDGAVIDILYGGCRFDCRFFTACLQVVTLTALQTAGAFVCAHDYYCAVRTVQAAQPL